MLAEKICLLELDICIFTTYFYTGSKTVIFIKDKIFKVFGGVFLNYETTIRDKKMSPCECFCP